MYCHFFIHSPGNGHLDCFPSLAAVNNTTLNMGVKVPLQDPDLNLFGYICMNKNHNKAVIMPLKNWKYLK